VGTPLDGDRDLGGGRCRNRSDIPIKPLGTVDRRQRGACDIRACAHRYLEQISGVVSLDIPADDYSGGARGCAAATAREQGPQRGLPRTEVKFHRRKLYSARAGFIGWRWIPAAPTRRTQILFQGEYRIPSFSELEGIVEKTTKVVPVLTSALDKYREKIDLAWIYGSMARGQEHEAAISI